MPLAFVIVGTTLFGAPLPHTVIAWLGTLIGLWGSLGTAQVVLLAYYDEHSGQRVKVRLTGYILPFGWILWGAALIYDNPNPFHVLIVLLGLFAMLVTARELHRSRANSVVQAEGESA
jgi:hypothetical protein